MVRGTSKLPGRMTSRNTVADFPPKDQRDEAGFVGPLNRTSSFASLFVASYHRSGDRHHKFKVRRVTAFPNRSRRYPTWKSESTPRWSHFLVSRGGAVYRGT